MKKCQGRVSVADISSESDFDYDSVSNSSDSEEGDEVF